MKALGEQGLDVLVDEIKKRTDGVDGKNGGGNFYERLEHFIISFHHILEDTGYLSNDFSI